MCVHMTCKRERLGKPRSHCDVRAAKMWNRLSREVVLAPSWGFCPTRWIKHRTAWSDLRAEPVLSRRLGLVTSWGPSLPEFSCDPISLWAALLGEETNLPAALPVSVDGYQRQIPVSQRAFHCSVLTLSPSPGSGLGRKATEVTPAKAESEWCHSNTEASAWRGPIEVEFSLSATVGRCWLELQSTWCCTTGTEEQTN